MNQNYLKAEKEYLKGEKSLSVLSKEYSISRWSLTKYLKSKNIEITRMNNKFKVDSNIFNTIDTEHKAYWLGFMYADGYVWEKGIELSLGIKDLNHLIKFKRFLKSEHKIGLNKTNFKGRYRCRISIKDKTIVKDLIRLGCNNKKSLTLKFPTSDIVPDDLIRHFIRGYFDGDGSFYAGKASGKNYTLKSSVLGTKEFLTELDKVLNIAKPRKLYQDKRHRNNTYFIEWGSESNSKLVPYLYQNCSIFLDRKLRFIYDFCRFNEKFLKLLESNIGEPPSDT